MTDKSLPPLLLKASQSYLEDALHKGVGKAMRQRGASAATHCISLVNCRMYDE